MFLCHRAAASVLQEHFLLVCVMAERSKKNKIKQPKTAGYVLARTPWRPKLNTTSVQMTQRGGARRFQSKQATERLDCSSLLSPGTSMSEESHLVSWQQHLSSRCRSSGGADLMTEKQWKKLLVHKSGGGRGSCHTEKDFCPSGLWSRNDLRHQFENFIYALGLFFTFKMEWNLKWS